jgi:polysaccharide export outer membrane protein
MTLLTFLVALTLQTPTLPPPPPPPIPTAAAASSRTTPEYVVGNQDRLAITVVDEPALTRVITVGSDGAFDYPFIGMVKAAGATLRSIQQDITARLKEKYLRNPQVSIEVESYRSQVVYVWGQVRNPGAVTLMGNISLTEALAKAGSPTPDAGTYIEISRRPATGAAPAEEGAKPERVSMSELQTGRAQSVSLSDGDTVFVPKAEMVFVTGYVRNAGPFLHDAAMTVSRALSMAGGVTEKGSRTRIRITRQVDGKQVVIKDVRLDDVVLPGDSIEVLSRIW